MDLTWKILFYGCIALFAYAGMARMTARTSRQGRWWWRVALVCWIIGLFLVLFHRTMAGVP